MSTLSRFAQLSTLVLACNALACSKDAPETTPPTSGDASPQTSDADATAQASSADSSEASTKLAEVLAGPQRSEENKARDAYRHPAETLAFFGVQPTDHVIELWPGSGWYTEILAPYTADGGKLTVTLFDKDGPESYYGTTQAQKMLDRFAADEAMFGHVDHVVVPQTVEFDKDGKVSNIEVQPFDLGDGVADVVLTFRNSHGWFRRGVADMVYGAAFKALEPGGVLGVVQHRAAEGADPNKSAEQGYLPEKDLVEAITKAGFVLEETSEINANPKDTKDYEGGVWTLPPSLSQGDADRPKYLDIGESDRMTLKFRKPAQ